MSRWFSRFLGSRWDRVTEKGLPKEQEESLLSGRPTIPLVDDTKGIASYSDSVSRESTIKDTSTDISKVTTLPQDVNRVPASKSKGLDIVFLQDSTGSQGQYIKSARDAIQSICSRISSSTTLSAGHIRFGLIAFRDHPPQDRTFVTQNFGFTSSIFDVKKNLNGLSANGGGDGPEASTAALAEALKMEWREEASKVVVLITDAPPHGIGEKTDGFPSGSPDGNDPLIIARQMAERGIVLFVVACEPSLTNNYKNAVDFYLAIAEITNGRVLPLTKASRLGDYIVGSAVEAIETDELVKQAAAEIVNDFYDKSMPLEILIEEVHNKFRTKGMRMQRMDGQDEYQVSSTGETNIKAWKEAETVADGKDVVSTDHGGYELVTSTAPEAALTEAPIEYDQTRRVVMSSIMRSSKVTPQGLFRKAD